MGFLCGVLFVFALELMLDYFFPQFSDDPSDAYLRGYNRGYKKALRDCYNRELKKKLKEGD